MSRHRGSKRGARRDEWADEGPGDFQEPNFFSRRAEAGQADPVEAEVLWFNVPKGFGFVQPSVGDKAFLHIKQLEAAGISEIDEGARLRVVIEPGPKGLNVTRVVEVLSTPAVPAGRQEQHRSVASPDGPEVEAAGTVKWYSAEKGFGFIGQNDGGQDIFVHATALSRSGISALEEGQAVSVRYVEGKKGLEAKVLHLM